MKITILSEVRASEGFHSEHGLSFLIDADGEIILFDTGASDIFIRNAEKLDVDLSGVKTVVLSHGHFDHGDGLQFIRDKTLICHPGCFVKRFRKNDSWNIGLALRREEIENRFSLRPSKDQVRLTENLWFLGEIPRLNDFEARSTRYVLEGGEEDFIMDDSGLACTTDKGLVVISGCAHSGICNMVQHAKKVTGASKVRAVIGGFHLQNLDEQTRSTVKCLKGMNTEEVYPSHCTMEPAIGLFHREFGKNDVLAGADLVF